MANVPEKDKKFVNGLFDAMITADTWGKYFPDGIASKDKKLQFKNGIECKTMKGKYFEMILHCSNSTYNRMQITIDDFSKL